MISSGFIGFRSRGSQLGIFGSSFCWGVDSRDQDEIVYIEESCLGEEVEFCVQAERGKSRRKNNRIFFIYLIKNKLFDKSTYFIDSCKMIYCFFFKKNDFC